MAGITKLKGGVKFPPAIVVELVPKEFWSFIMVQGTADSS
jgi:hypothetical protein